LIVGETLGKLFVDVTSLPGGSSYHPEGCFLNNMTTSNPSTDLKPMYCWETDVSVNNVFGFVQLLFFLGTYGYVLFFSSNLIADGSELLLLIPKYEGIVGSVVLPVLGAVPDGAIVLFSGLGADAQEQLNVGMGGLAGSTVMLLTIPWLLAVFAGRVNIENGVANYAKKVMMLPCAASQHADCVLPCIHCSPSSFRRTTRGSSRLVLLLVAPSRRTPIGWSRRPWCFS
jgi:hypothetical protein